MRTFRVWAVLLVLLAARPAWAAGAFPKFDISTIAISGGDRGAPQEPLPGPSANSSGDVVFVTAERGADVLFLRSSLGFTIPIVNVGDALAESSVTRLVSMPNSLDPYKQILFYAVLADHRAGLFLATPPANASAVSPAWGYRDRSVIFHLTGNGIAPGLQVRFGAVQAGFITVISPTELTGVIPAGAAAGRVDVTIGRGNRTYQTLPAAFEFRDPPVSGCRGFWPDHRPPEVTASSLVSGWLPWAAIVLAALARRWRRVIDARGNGARGDGRSISERCETS